MSELPTRAGSEPADDPIPLPPDEIVERMMAETENVTTSPASRPLEVAKLQFTGSKPWSKDVVLDFPFQLGEREIRTVTVRRLTTAEVGEIAGALLDRMTMWDAYAAMTDLPAEVLRGLEASDGAAVTDIAYDFLPRQLRGS